jgi:hypothetical protein
MIVSENRALELQTDGQRVRRCVFLQGPEALLILRHLRRGWEPPFQSGDMRAVPQPVKPCPIQK